MKGFTWAALAASLLLSAPAFAGDYISGKQKVQPDTVRTDVVGGTSRSDSLVHPLAVTSTGLLSITDTARDRDHWTLVQNFFNNQLGASGTSLTDSSSVVDVHDLKRMVLYLYPQFDSLSTVVRVAVQVRSHYTSAADSSNAYPWVRWPARPQAANASIAIANVLAINTSDLHLAAAAASLGDFASIPNGSIATGDGLLPNTIVQSHNTSDSGLVIRPKATQSLNGTVTFYPPGSVPTNTVQIDSLGDLTTGTMTLAQATDVNTTIGSSGLWPGEFLVKFNIAKGDTLVDGGGKYGGYPKGVMVQLTDQSGAWLWSPYISVRFRILNGVRSRFRIRCDLAGSSL